MAIANVAILYVQLYQFGYYVQLNANMTITTSILRKVAGVTRMDHIRNEEIRHRLQQRSTVDVVRERRERWRVKVMEKPEGLVERVMVRKI